MGTNLEEQLRKSGHSSLVIAGFMTNKCVESTVRSAADLGFDVCVLADGTATVGQHDHTGRWWEADEVHLVALASMTSERTRVVETAELLSQL